MYTALGKSIIKKCQESHLLCAHPNLQREHSSVSDPCFYSKMQIKFVIWAWWCVPVIPALRRLRHEDLEFKASWGYTERCYLKKNFAIFSISNVTIQ
jgi:hypothetical protein